MTPGMPTPPSQTVRPAPAPLSWRWNRILGMVQRDDGPDEPVVLVQLILNHQMGEFVGHWLPESLDQLGDQAKEQARLARTGIETYSQIPPGIGRPGPPGANGG